MLWFQFPEGCTSISVNQQLFEVEYIDRKGVGYFRAPELYKNTILGLGSFVEQIPKVDLKELETKHQIPALFALVDELRFEKKELQESLRISEDNLEVLHQENLKLRIKLNQNVIK